MSDTDEYFADVKQAQAEIGAWSREQFGDQDSVNPLIGAQEELGEVAQITLKRRQGIREDEFTNEDLEIEVADVIIYLMDFCERNDVSMSNGLEQAQRKVLGRDFDSNITNTSNTQDNE